MTQERHSGFQLRRDASTDGQAWRNGLHGKPSPITLRASVHEASA